MASGMILLHHRECKRNEDAAILYKRERGCLKTLTVSASSERVDD